MKIWSLGFIQQDVRSVYLARKTRGLLRHRWNGYGGKKHPRESIVHSLQRELYEEARVRVQTRNCVPVGILYQHDHTGEIIGRCHIFVVRVQRVHPYTTREMREPKPFPVRRLPTTLGRPGDDRWVRAILRPNVFVIIHIDVRGRQHISVLKKKRRSPNVVQFTKQAPT